MASNPKKEGSSTDDDPFNDIVRECVDAYRDLGKAMLSRDEKRIAKARARWEEAERRRAQFERPSTD